MTQKLTDEMSTMWKILSGLDARLHNYSRSGRVLKFSDPASFEPPEGV